MNRRTAVSVMAMMAASGCNLNRSDSPRETVFTKIGGGGQLIEPRRCNLQVAILARPLHDKAVDAALWRVVDEQSIAPEARRVLDANGLRAGALIGGLPAEVESLLKADPPHRVEPMQFSVPDGTPAMISLRESVPKASIFLNRDGRAFGKDYQDATGWLRATASYEGDISIKLRIVPEIHHGPIQRGFTALPNAGTLSPQQFMQKDGQQEDSLRELAATVTVQPGQIVVVGTRPEAKGSLGAFLFTQPEANSDRLLQKAVLIWARRSSFGASGANEPAPPALVPVEPPKS